MRLLYPPIVAKGRNYHSSLRIPTTFLAATAFLAGHQLPTARSLAVSMTTTATATATKNVVAIEGRPAESTAETSKEFLLSRPPGAYTTARTCAGGRRIFEWEAHVERTARSLASMMERDETVTPAAAAELSDPVVLRRRLDAAVEEAVRLHRELHAGDETRELKLTALVGWTGPDADGDADDDADGSAGWVACHATTLPPLPAPPVRVEIRGSPRDNAAAKDSAWVSERAPLEALMRAATCGSVNELLLATEGGDLLEGSQTNFYAVRDGALWTAGEGILEGTVRGLVLDVCRRNGIPVVLRPPSLDALDEWEGALISSTSRLALPIDELYLPAEGRPSSEANLRRAIDNTRSGSVAARIRDLVALEVEARSTPIGGSLPMV